MSKLKFMVIDLQYAALLFLAFETPKTLLYRTIVLYDLILFEHFKQIQKFKSISSGVYIFKLFQSQKWNVEVFII